MWHYTNPSYYLSFWGWWTSTGVGNADLRSLWKLNQIRHAC